MSKKSLTYQENPWFYIAIALLGGLLFLPPYFRGLFFPKEQLIAFIVALWAFFATWVWKASRRELTFFRTPMDYFALAVVVCYLIAIFGAANYRLAVQGFIKVTLFFLVYWMAGELGRKDQWARILLGILYATGVGVALAGLGAALGVLDINDGFVGNRIFSTLQYPNSLAIYLIAMSFLGFYFWASMSKWAQFLFATGNYLLLMTFLGTNSRGGILVAALVIPVFIIGLPKEHRVWVFFSLLFTGGGVLVGSLRFIPSIVAEEPGKAWAFLGLGLAITLAGQLVLTFSRRYLGDRRTVFALAGLISLVLVAGGLFVSQREVVYNQITNPNIFNVYTDAAATMTPGEDGWRRVDVTRVGNHSLIGRTGGYSVKPGETVVYTVEVKSPSGKWAPYLTGSRGIGPFEQTGNSTWTITWTNEDEVNRGEYIFFRYEGEPNQDVADTFYYRNPAAVIAGQTVSFWQKILPRQLAERLKTIDLETSSSQERVYWSGEAIRMIKERPFFGYGGGGWESAYRSKQTYNYASTQVHNDWLQLGVETGAIGFLAWLGLWLAFLYQGFKVLRTRGGNQRTQAWAIIAGAVAIGGHAWIDFDLSLGALSLALWFGLGLIGGMTPHKTSLPEKQVSRKQRKRHYKTTSHYQIILGVGVLCLVFTLATGSLLLGHHYGSQGVAAIQEGDGDAGLDNFLKASTYDPFQASYHIDAARLTLMKGDIEEAISLGKKAIAKDRFNWQIHLNLAEIYWQQENVEASIRAAEQARDCAPLMQNVNNSLARAYALAGIRYLEDGHLEAAEEVFRKLAAMPEAFTSYFDRLPEHVQQMWSPARRLKVDQELALNLAIAEYFLGRLPQAAEHLELALKNEANEGEAMLWLAVVKEKLGQIDEARELMEQLLELDEGIAQNYVAIINLPILNN